MNDLLHLQVQLAAAPAQVFAALTDNGQLQRWFAEHTAVDLATGRYDFWGRYTPVDLPEAEGHNPLHEVVLNERLAFTWSSRKVTTDVAITLRPAGDGTRLILQQQAVTAEGQPVPWLAEDFWFLTLENLRRYLLNRPVTRCDYRAFVKGDISWSLEIDASPQAIYDAIIRPDQLEQWIASNARVEPVVGGRFDIGWGDDGGTKLLELVPGEKISFGWAAWGDQPATTVTWTIARSGGKSRLTLFHSGFASDADAPEQEGWLNYMVRLRSLLELGADWSPVVKALPESLAFMYPKAMIERQDWLMA